MKCYSSLILFALCAAVYSFGQAPFSYATQEKFIGFSAIAAQGDTILLAGRSRSCHVPYLEWWEGSSGTKLAFNLYPTSRYGSYTDVQIDSSGKVWAAGFLVQADDVPDMPSSVLSVFGADRSLLKRYKRRDDAAATFPIGVYPTSGGEAIWRTGSKIYQLAADGTLTDSLAFDAPIELLQLAPGGQLLVKLAGRDSVEFRNLDGEAVGLLTATPGIKALLCTGSNAYWLTDSLVHGQNIETNQSATAPTNGREFNRLASYGQSALLYQEATDSTELTSFSLNSGELTTIGQWKAKDRSLSELVPQAGLFYAVGSNSFAGPDAFYDIRNGFAQAFLSPEAATLGTDLSVESVELSLDSVYLSYNTMPESYLLIIAISATINVQNRGTADFEGDFVLASNRTDGFNCTEKRLYTLRSGQIEAGGSEVFQLSINEQGFFAGAPPEQVDYDTEVLRCFFTGAPEGLLDPNPSNNGSCASLEVGGSIVSTRTVQTGPYIRIYPNPARSELTVAFPGLEVQQIQLLDGRGRSLLTAPAAGSSEKRLDVSSLPAGFYWLSLQTSGGRLARKLAIY